MGSVRQVLASVGQETPKEKSRSGKKLERTMPLKIWRGVLSPFPGLDSWGLRQCPPTPWAVMGALAVGLLVCLFMLFSIQAGLESLREELAVLRREGMCQAPRADDNRDTPDSRQVGEGGGLCGRRVGPLGPWGLRKGPLTSPHFICAILDRTQMHFQLCPEGGFAEQKPSSGSIRHPQRIG